MSRKKDKWLPEQEIQRLEGMSKEQLVASLKLLSPENQQELIAKLLVSYRTAARVANAAWGFWQSCGDLGHGLDTDTESERMNAALHDYAPARFIMPVYVQEWLAEELEYFYNQSLQMGTIEEMQDALFERLDQTHRELDRHREKFLEDCRKGQEILDQEERAKRAKTPLNRA
jgi:hypothetical protein